MDGVHTRCSYTFHFLVRSSAENLEQIQNISICGTVQCSHINSFSRRIVWMKGFAENFTKSISPDFNTNSSKNLSLLMLLNAYDFDAYFAYYDRVAHRERQITHIFLVLFSFYSLIWVACNLTPCASLLFSLIFRNRCCCRRLLATSICGFF